MSSEDLSRYRLSSHLIVALAMHLVFALPSFLLLIALGLLAAQSALILFALFSLASPIAGLFTWLIDRGSNGENAIRAIEVLGLLPSRFYGVIVGGLIGNDLGGGVWAVLGAILFYFIGRYVGFRFGSAASVRLAEHLSHTKSEAF